MQIYQGFFTSQIPLPDIYPSYTLCILQHHPLMNIPIPLCIRTCIGLWILPGTALICDFKSSEFSGGQETKNSKSTTRLSVVPQVMQQNTLLSEHGHTRCYKKNYLMLTN